MSLTGAIAMDCEMVGAGPNGRITIPARVSLVNEHGQCVYDKYVKPTQQVTDYRTFVSGVTANQLANGTAFDVVKRDVAERIRGRVLVGHDVKKDLEVLGLTHPEGRIKDTINYPPHRARSYEKPSLKDLASKHLGVSIQNGAHSSLEDATAAMKLYNLAKSSW